MSNVRHRPPPLARTLPGTQHRSDKMFRRAVGVVIPSHPPAESHWSRALSSWWAWPPLEAAESCAGWWACLISVTVIRERKYPTTRSISTPAGGIVIEGERRSLKEDLVGVAYPISPCRHTIQAHPSRGGEIEPSPWKRCHLDTSHLPGALTTHSHTNTVVT